jgi:F0F1-type ATP synthase membrane subunit b/b'
VRSQFNANRHEQDEEKIEAAKNNAIRSLSNYMLYQSAQQVPQLQKAMKAQITDAKKDLGTRRTAITETTTKK